MLRRPAQTGTDGAWAALEEWRGRDGNVPLLAEKLGRFLLNEGRHDILLALFSVRHYFRRYRPGFRFGEIADLGGRGLEESLETFVSEDRKFRLRALLTPQEPKTILL